MWSREHIFILLLCGQIEPGLSRYPDLIPCPTLCHWPEQSFNPLHLHLAAGHVEQFAVSFRSMDQSPSRSMFFMFPVLLQFTVTRIFNFALVLLPSTSVFSPKPPSVFLSGTVNYVNDESDESFMGVSSYLGSPCVWPARCACYTLILHCYVYNSRCGAYC